MTLTENQLPKHSHIYTDDDEAGGKLNVDGASFPQPTIGKYSTKVSRGASGRGTGYSTSCAGKNEAIDKRPPYYTLAYIMKV